MHRDELILSMSSSRSGVSTPGSYRPRWARASMGAAGPVPTPPLAPLLRTNAWGQGTKGAPWHQAASPGPSVPSITHQPANPAPTPLSKSLSTLALPLLPLPTRSKELINMEKQLDEVIQDMKQVPHD